MNITDFDSTIENSIPKVATIGMFDGVHLGHQLVISKVCAMAKAEGKQNAVITFSDHPQFLLNPDYQLELLMTCSEKIKALEQLGIENVIIIEFNKEIAMMSSLDFMKHLYDKFGVRTLIVGYDHKFGHDRNATFNDYVEQGKSIGINIIKAPEYTDGIGKISSSVIRKLLHEGNVSEANAKLGGCFTRTGKVVHGAEVGRTLGFPTANIEPENNKLIVPANGVYAVKVAMESGKMYNGVCNIGMRPTLNDGRERTIETHILDFDGDLYCTVLTLRFVEFIRAEKRFNSLDELKMQIAADKNVARQILEKSKI